MTFERPTPKSNQEAVLTDGDQEAHRAFTHYVREQMNTKLPPGLEEWSADAYSVAETLMAAAPEDFANESYVNAQLEGANLSDTELPVVMSVVSSYHNEVHGDSDKSESLSLSVDAAHEKLSEVLPALAADLDALQPSDNEYESLRSLRNVLDKHALEMVLDTGGTGGSVKGFPVTIGEAGLDLSEFGGKIGKISSGAYENILQRLEESLKNTDVDGYRKIFETPMQPVIAATIHRLF